MKKLCLIPARGGSKRIPRKNIKDFLGKPIIAYSIETALNSGLFDKVIVSTDDDEIAEIAKEYGAEVPFIRSERNSDDYATLSDVTVEVISYYNSINNIYDYICIVLPTAPLLKEYHLKTSFNLLIEKNADAITPIVRFSSPIQRALKIVGGRIEMFDSTHFRTRSQDLEVAYYDAGLFYWKSVKTIENDDVVKLGYIMSENEVQDIDTDQDWKIAEFKYKHLKL